MGNNKSSGRSRRNTEVETSLLWDHGNCSDNLAVFDNDLKVRRKDAANRTDMVRATVGFLSGVHVWEITWPRASRGTHAVIGVATTRAPLACSGYKSLLGSNDQSLGWDIVNNKTLHDNRVINAYPANKPPDYQVGDRIVVILNLNEGTISFCDGDEKLGQCLKGLDLFARRNQALYPAVSITKPGAVVEIRNLSERTDDNGAMLDGENKGQQVQSPQPTDAPTTRADRIEMGIKQTLALMNEKKANKVKDVILAVSELNMKANGELTSVEHRVMLANKIAELGGGPIIMGYLNFLRQQGLEVDDNFQCYYVLLRALSNATNDSMKLSMALAENGLFELLHTQLTSLKTKLVANKQKFGPLLATCLEIVCKCAKRSDKNRNHLHKVKLDEVLQHFLNTSINDENILLICYTFAVFILNPKTVDHLTISVPALRKLVGFLKVAAADSAGGFHCAHDFGPLGDVRMYGDELVMAVGALAQNKEARKVMADNGVFEHLVTYVAADTDTYHQELTLTAIHALLGHDTVPMALQVSGLLPLVDRLMTSTTDGVRHEATRVSEKIMALKIPPKPSIDQVMPIDRTRKCDFAARCQKFVAGLKLADAYFDTSHNICYCAKCYEAVSGDQQPYFARGQPAKMYGLPIGWYRCGLKAPARAAAENAFKVYHRAYHGTDVDAVTKILREGHLLIPGDETIVGDEIREKTGHFTADWKPAGFDTNQVFLSPSIRYVGHPAYAKPSKVTIDGKEYKAQVALQVLIHPDAYTVGPQTVGAKSQIDPRFSNDEMEWSTKRRGAVIVYGLLVRVME